MGILLLKKIQQRDTLQAAEYALLSSLAAECPFISGPAVYSARTLLFETKGEQYWNDCEDYSPSLGTHQRIKKEDVEKEAVVKIYPNPTNGSITIEIPLKEKQTGLMEVFDLQGKKIKEQKLLSKIQTVTFSLTPGFYFYNLKIGGKVLKSDKLVISE